jgi:DnaJ-class molecular chaperone
MEGVVVMAAVGAVGYLLLVRVSPITRCPSCKGKRVRTSGRKARPCRRCKGTGKAARRGARLVHRTARSRRDGIR